MAQRFFGFLNATRQYLKTLNAQAIGLPSYGVLESWDNFIRNLSPRPTNASMIQPRNLAAYYPNDPSALYLDGSNNVILWEDRSGNSATNALILPGANNATNYASTPSSNALNVTGDIDVRVYASLPNWFPGGNRPFFSKHNTNQRAYRFSVFATTAIPVFGFSIDGVNNIDATSTVGLPVTNFQAIWTRATRVAATGAVTFYYSFDGNTWTQLGDVVIATAGNIFASTSNLEIGTFGFDAASTITQGNFYRIQILNGINGPAVFDMDMSRVPKLSTSFTESSVNAATVTINTAGDTGAHVAGDRDLYQGTSTKRPAYTAAAGSRRLFLTFDGVNDYLKAPSFTLSQPETTYLTGSQITWTSNDKFFDGNSTTERMVLQQTVGGVSPNLQLNGGSASTNYTNFPLGTLGIIIAIFNGAASSINANRIGQTTLSAGTNSGNGLTLAAAFDGTGGGNITVSELSIYSELHNVQTQQAIVGYLANKYAIGL